MGNSGINGLQWKPTLGCKRERGWRRGLKKLDALRVVSLTGDVPQNVNFSIKASVVRAFLETNGVEFRTEASTVKLDIPALADQAQKYTLSGECWK